VLQRVAPDQMQGRVDTATPRETNPRAQYGDASPLDAGRFSLGQADGVYDMIYRPASTPLLDQARAAGCRTANGLGMLLYQGAAALELWSGRPAPVEVMSAALHREIYGAGGPG
jgi:shikimate dehydrogenase